ncbi:MAG: hypothetical protein IPF98_22560 [Gemmatimonadetes bacterium]|nr:hypothetical protein [Gemmatimonadota bacterium]
MPLSEREIQLLLEDRQLRVLQREDIALPQRSIAEGLQATTGEFARWLDTGAPGAPLTVMSETANRLELDLHCYPRADVLEVLDRAGRALEFQVLRGTPEFGRVGSAQSLAYLRHGHDGDACAIRLGAHTIVIARNGAVLEMALVQRDSPVAHPPATTVRMWAEHSTSDPLRQAVERSLATEQAWDALVASALLAFVAGVAQPAKIRSFEDLKSLRLAEPRPVEWIRSLEATSLRGIEERLALQVEALRAQLQALGERDDDVTEAWCTEYARCAWDRASVEVIAWLVRRHPAAERSRAPFHDVDLLGEKVRPVLEELVERDPIVAQIAQNDPGSWWDAGTLPDDLV